MTTQPRAAGYADELLPVLNQWLLGQIEHVGSSAIPAIVAKPVIDLMAQVADTDAVVGQAGGTLEGRVRDQGDARARRGWLRGRRRGWQARR